MFLVVFVFILVFILFKIGYNVIVIFCKEVVKKVKILLRLFFLVERNLVLNVILGFL